MKSLIYSLFTVLGMFALARQSSAQSEGFASFCRPAPPPAPTLGPSPFLPLSVQGTRPPCLPPAVACFIRGKAVGVTGGASEDKSFARGVLEGAGAITGVWGSELKLVIRSKTSYPSSGLRRTEYSVEIQTRTFVEQRGRPKEIWATVFCGRGEALYDRRISSRERGCVRRAALAAALANLR